MNRDIVGVGVSRAHLDVYRLTTGEHARFANSFAGLGAFESWLGQARLDLVVYEP